MNHKIYICTLNFTVRDTDDLQRYINEECVGSVFAHSVRGNQIFLRAGYATTAVDIERALADLYNADCFKSTLEVPVQQGTFADFAEALGEIMPPERKMLTIIPQRSPASVPAEALSGFIGIDNIRSQFTKTVQSVLRNRRSNLKLNTTIEDPILSSLIAGPTGTGKTELAKAMANDLKTAGLVAPDAPIVCILANSLVGLHVGKIENFLFDKMKEAKDGILILDEIDAWLDVYSYGTSAFHTLNGYMGHNRNAPIIIATCLGKTAPNVLLADDGIGRRFASQYYTTAYDTETLTDMFCKLVIRSGLTLEPGFPRSLVSNLIDVVKDVQRDQFGNGGAVTNIFNAVMAERSLRMDNSGENAWLDGEEKISPARACQLLRVVAQDIPDFHRESRCFVSRPPEREDLTPSRAQSTSGVVTLFPGARP